SVGPKSPASDAGQPTLNITSTAVNAAVDILLTPAGPPAITAQSVTKTGSGHTLVSATNMALTMPSPVAGGLICIAHLAVSGNNIITRPAGWTKIRSDINGTASTQALFWHLTNGSEPASYSWNGGAGSVFYEGAITCYSGVNPTTPLDPGAPTGAAATGTGTSITAPSLTLQTAGDR